MEKIEIKNPGQYYVNSWIIYDALGGPAIDENKWSLKVSRVLAAILPIKMGLETLAYYLPFCHQLAFKVF